MSKATKEDVLHELMEVSKALQVTITSSTTRKNKVDDLITPLPIKRMKKNRLIVKNKNLEVKRRKTSLKSKLSDDVNQGVLDIWFDMCCLM